MSNEMIELVRLINENRTLNEIVEITGLSNQQIFVKLGMLKNSGYVVNRKYYASGDIRYFLNNPFLENIGCKSEIQIEYSDIPSKIQVLLTSDPHYNSIYDSFKNADLMREYCIKEGIHLIFNVGDFFEGILPNFLPELKYKNIGEQIQYVLKNYPYDKGILTIAVLGNHDASIWASCGIDIKTVLQDRRHDIVPIGYGYGKVNLGGCPIVMQHPLERFGISFPPNSKSIILKGHSHKFKCGYSGNLIIYVPSSSNKKMDNSSAIPSFIDMQLMISSPLRISEVYLQQFAMLNNEVIRISEVNYQVNFPLEIEEKIKTGLRIDRPDLCLDSEIIMPYPGRKIRNQGNLQ